MVRAHLGLARALPCGACPSPRELSAVSAPARHQPKVVRVRECHRVPKVALVERSYGAHGEIPRDVPTAEEARDLGRERGAWGARTRAAPTPPWRDGGAQLECSVRRAVREALRRGSRSRGPRRRASRAAQPPASHVAVRCLVADPVIIERAAAQCRGAGGGGRAALALARREHVDALLEAPAHAGVQHIPRHLRKGGRERGRAMKPGACHG